MGRILRKSKLAAATEMGASSRQKSNHYRDKRKENVPYFEGI